MKIFKGLRWIVLAAVVLLGATGRMEGQTLNYSATSTASTLLVSNSLAFFINITNLTGPAVSDLIVTDTLPASVRISSQDGGGANESVSSNMAVFTLLSFPQGDVLHITLNVIPTAPGLFTNTVSIYTPDLITNEVTNLVVNVTNFVVIANLGVTLTSQTSSVFVNDQTSYGITVTNAGPDGVPDVLLTNTLPPGVVLNGISPANQAYTRSGTNLIFDLGGIASTGYRTLSVAVTPTNAGALNYFAAVGAASVTNASFLNTTTNGILTVLNPATGLLTVATNSSQIDNYQIGLEEQSILLSNVGTDSITNARVVVAGLTNQLYNAVGTNGGNPYVVYTSPVNAPLAPGQSVSLVLQFNPPIKFPFNNSQLTAYPVSAPNLTPPAATGTSTNINISGIFRLPNDNILIEFPAVAGRTYTVVYSDNVNFSNAMVAPPSFVSPANIIQWIDEGPPATVSAPTNNGNRFYRVLQNP